MPNHMLLMSFSPANGISNLNTTLNRFLEFTLNMTQKSHDIKIAFIGTATNDRTADQLFFSSFMWASFRKHIKTSKLSLTSSNLTEEQLETYLSTQDIIFVGGGNTEQMLNIWEHKGFTSVLASMKERDTLPILAGVSAGGMYPFTAGLSDSTEEEYKPLRCLGWLKESFCPHADSLIQRTCVFDDDKQWPRLAAYQRAIALNELPQGYAVPDDCLLHFYGDKYIQSLAAKEGITPYYLEKNLTVKGYNMEALETTTLTKLNIEEVIKNTFLKLELDNIQSEEPIKENFSCQII
jgi:dipeptidase E